MPRLSFFVCLILVVSPISSLAPQRMCGRMLIKTLTTICKGNFCPQEDGGASKNIVNECCEKKCTMEFLQSFCCQPEVDESEESAEIERALSQLRHHQGQKKVKFTPRDVYYLQ